MTPQTFQRAAIEAIVKVADSRVMIDSAELLADGSLTAHRTLKLDEPAFRGHFPGHPILPGVLQIEAMRQLAQVAVANGLADPSYTRLAGLRALKFRRPVNPGERLDVELSLVETGDGQATFQAKCSVDGQVSSEGRLIVAPPAAPAPAGPEGHEGESVKELAEVKDSIPHREPFLFIERVASYFQDPGEINGLYGLRRIREDDHYLAPAPGVDVPPEYLVEMSAQAGCVYLLPLPAYVTKLAYFMSIDTADFSHPVQVGDLVVNRVRLTSLRDKFGKCDSQLYVRGVHVGSLAIKFAFVDR